MISLYVDCMVVYLFEHDCLLHDCPFSCMIACRLCLWGALVSPYFRITSLGWLFLIGFLNCLGVIPNCLPSTKLRPPHMILSHPHHHHHLDLPYNRITQSHLHHHPQFSQPHRQRPLSYMVRKRLCHILLWPLYGLQMILRPVLRGLSKGWGHCMSSMESWIRIGMMTCLL